MKEAFAYIIGLGAAVMMPVIFTVLGVLIGIKPAKALKSGLLVGVGFVGLGVVTALLTTSLGPALKGRNARFASRLQVGDKVSMVGRIQSREYQKLLENGEAETRVAYEISISRLNYAEEEI